MLGLGLIHKAPQTASAIDLVLEIVSTSGILSISSGYHCYYNSYIAKTISCGLGGYLLSYDALLPTEYYLKEFRAYSQYGELSYQVKLQSTVYGSYYGNEARTGEIRYTCLRAKAVNGTVTSSD